MFKCQKASSSRHVECWVEKEEGGGRGRERGGRKEEGGRERDRDRKGRGRKVNVLDIENTKW